MKICILLSAYNGEKYIEEQLESLINQQGVEIDILVRDDGSSDKTHEILDKWQNKGLLKWYKGENLGFAKSFMNLVQKAADYEYYAFCDQDDIWLPEKLKRAVDMLSKIENDINLYCSNVYYYKNGVTYGGIHKQVPVFDKYTSMVRNIAPGCSMVFSRRLKDILAAAPPRKLIAHDFWIFQSAMLLGEVVYDFTPTMLYRQHENNQIGQKVSRMGILKRRIKHFLNKGRRHEREQQAKEILYCFGNILPAESRRICSVVACYRESLKNKIDFLSDGRYTMETTLRTLYFKFRIIFNMV
ncbi:MAG: glycosyltransferase family 2 protein [Bacteroidales bacterium]|nr:glycosyltransferase family 2 protein [Bacteroidales bacterium]